MRLLTDIARKRDRITLLAPPSKLPIIYMVLGKLYPRVDVRTEGPGIKIPLKVMDSARPEITMPVWLALLFEGSKKIRIGIDPGQRNFGIAILVGDVLAYTGTCRNPEDVAGIIRSVINIVDKDVVIIKIGSSTRVPLLIEKLEEMKVKVQRIDEKAAKDRIIIGDFSSMHRGRLARHEIDAIKIALYPEELFKGYH